MGETDGFHKALFLLLGSLRETYENSLCRVSQHGFREPERSALKVREHRERKKPRWMAGRVELT
jgi:hypothetical protein